MRRYLRVLDDERVVDPKPRRIVAAERERPLAGLGHEQQAREPQREAVVARLRADVDTIRRALASRHDAVELRQLVAVDVDLEALPLQALSRRVVGASRLRAQQERGEVGGLARHQREVVREVGPARRRIAQERDDVRVVRTCGERGERRVRSSAACSSECGVRASARPQASWSRLGRW